jgi:hypothetical protein
LHKIFLASGALSWFHESMTRMLNMSAIRLCAQKQGFTVNAPGIDANPAYASAESIANRLTV